MTQPKRGEPQNVNDMLPAPVMFSVGLTEPNRDGVQWAILQADDGTVSARFRMPWQVAPQIGQSIAQGLTAIAQQAERNATGGLLLPPGATAGLIVPGGARVNGGQDGR